MMREKQESNKRNENEKPVFCTLLSSYELLSYSFVWLGLTGTAVYHVYKYTQENDWQFSHDDLQPSHFGLLKDVSDEDWNRYVNFVRRQLKPIAAYIAGVVLLRAVASPMWHRLMGTCMGMAFIGWCTHPTAVLLFGVQYVAVCILGGVFRSKKAVWIFQLVLIAALSLDVLWLWYYQHVSMEVYTVEAILVAEANMCVRLLSLGLDLTDIVAVDQKRLYLEGVYFTFYIPGLISGPVVPFKMFYNQRQNAPPLKNVNFTHLAVIVLRMAVWYVVLYSMQHVLHYQAIANHSHHLQSVSAWALYGVLYCNGQSFMLQYVQMYGWSYVVAALDGMEYPMWPDCISHVYSYRQMWRTFDRGLYWFTRDYIYVPLGGKRGTLQRKFMGICLSFYFIATFHGVSANYYIWATLNIVQVLLEEAGSYLYRETPLGRTVANKLSPRWNRRIVSLCLAMNTWLSIVSVYFYFTSYARGCIILSRMKESASAILLSLTAFYCVINVSMEWERHKYLRQHKLKQN